jgi:Tol biopolymer transport system component
MAEGDIFKIPASGGTPEHVTHGGGYYAVESPDGKWLYLLSLDHQLARMPTAGGEPVELAHTPRFMFTAHGVPSMAVATNGIYFLFAENQSDPGAGDALGKKNTVAPPQAEGGTIQFIGFDGGEPKTIGTIPKWPAAGLSVSPDGKYLLYSQYDQASAEIMLVDNFK